ncbi:MAG: alpha-hydroxy-acid oxidizing protein [Woeseiaceae bacterium]|nr:alpha-hydroxy-acid oxidizing protein [Woeseiaceae bacterium]NIP21090.1 alpha-hydroxy-acid oxidizing protein [Woeseiaceae bacterium]NIS90062.1 alpha-hydroxy-acid oxidizing protein [Woeseiaceae bacterium]
MRLKNCYRTSDFRKLAKQRLPAPIFHYIDGGSDDEVTLARNTAAFETVDLVPNVLAGVDEIDMSVTVLGQKLDMPLFFSPTAMQRLFHHDGEFALADAAEKYGTMFGVSTIGTRSIEELSARNDAAKLFQIYVHTDAALTSDLIARCKAANFGAMALTVDTIVAGNRERDYHTGMTTPPKLTPASLLSFAMHPRWTFNYLLREKFDLPNISSVIEAGSKKSYSVVDYLDTQLKRTIDWDDAAAMIEEWGGPFAIKGVMSVADARRCVDVGASAIMISNHGGRQLDGSRSPFDQLAAILDAVGGDIEVIVDGGIRRGTHVLKAMAMGATACSGGRMYLYALAGAGTAGVNRAMGLLRDEIERDMRLMGCSSIAELRPSMIAHRR